MSRHIDLSDNIVNDTFVQKYIGDNSYDCICLRCLRHFTASTYDIKTNKTKCCTRCNIVNRSEKQREHLEGTTINNWNVVKYIENKIYLCKCRNGHYQALSSNQLKNNKNIDCNECNGITLVNDLIDKQFNMLIPIKNIGNNVFMCKCNCGNIEFASRNQLETYLVQMCSNCKENIVNKIKYICNKEDINTWKNEVIMNIKGNKYQYSDSIITSNNKKIQIILANKDEYTVGKQKQNIRIQSEKEDKQVIFINKHEWILQPDKITRIVNKAINDNNESSVIYGRNTNVIKLNAVKEKEFLNRYHLQGYVASEICYALEYNKGIIALMSFGKTRFNSGYEYELLRLAYKDNIIVIGGTEKLFKQFIREINPQSIVSYCDISKFSGKTYGKLGFILDEITSPNYVWVSADESSVLPRYKTMKHKLLKRGLGTEQDTENSIMLRNGYTKVFDCGNIRFSWYK